MTIETICCLKILKSIGMLFALPSSVRGFLSVLPETLEKIGI